jgi:hypothetical protein
MRVIRSVGVLAVLAAGVSAGCGGCQRPAEKVVVYCAQDQEFAEGVFADFTAKAKLSVSPKFDTEANKSVSLAAELEGEAARPRCDVHWNNEILGTIRLARKGGTRRTRRRTPTRSRPGRRRRTAPGRRSPGGRGC